MPATVVKSADIAFAVPDNEYRPIADSEGEIATCFG